VTRTPDPRITNAGERQYHAFSSMTMRSAVIKLRGAYCYQLVPRVTSECRRRVPPGVPPALATTGWRR